MTANWPLLLITEHFSGAVFFHQAWYTSRNCPTTSTTSSWCQMPTHGEFNSVVPHSGISSFCFAVQRHWRRIRRLPAFRYLYSTWTLYLSHVVTIRTLANSLWRRLTMLCRTPAFTTTLVAFDDYIRCCSSTNGSFACTNCSAHSFCRFPA